jgi:hypothetical protein
MLSRRTLAGHPTLFTGDRCRSRVRRSGPATGSMTPSMPRLATQAQWFIAFKRVVTRGTPVRALNPSTLTDPGLTQRTVPSRG